MFGILALGFAMGLQHAMEADHLAAVATLASRHRRPADIVKHGITWGLGHATTLLALAGVVLILGKAIPDKLANVLELLVGVMLVLLGAQLLYRLWRGRFHLHVHEHDGAQHLHLHGHAAGDDHGHEHGFRWRTLAVGFMHGLAGSAALLLLAMSRVREPMWGFLYVLVFGVGSMVGMSALSAVLAVPMALSARFLSLAHNGLQAVIGLGTVCLGVVTMLAHLR